MDATDLLQQLLEADREYRAALRAVQDHGGTVLRAARQTLGLSQRGLAELMGVNFTTISKIENGHLPMGRPFVAKLARVVAGLPPVDERRTPAPALG